MNWKNRIVRTAEVPPQDLKAHPANARRHPPRQRRALASALDHIGVITDVIVNERSGHVLDGHLRLDLALAEKASTIPVKYVDLSASEEALVLATFDPVGSLAYLDLDVMRELRDDTREHLDQPLGDLLTDLAPDPIPEPTPDPDDAADGPHPNDGPEEDANTDLGYSLNLGSRTVMMTPAEFRELTDTFYAYLESRGMMFGFVRWLLA